MWIQRTIPAVPLMIMMMAAASLVTLCAGQSSPAPSPLKPSELPLPPTDTLSPYSAPSILPALMDNATTGEEAPSDVPSPANTGAISELPLPPTGTASPNSAPSALPMLMNSTSSDGGGSGGDSSTAPTSGGDRLHEEGWRLTGAAAALGSVASLMMAML